MTVVTKKDDNSRVLMLVVRSDVVDLIQSKWRINILVGILVNGSYVILSPVHDIYEVWASQYILARELRDVFKIVCSQKRL